LRAARGGGVEHLVEGGAIHQVGRAAEEFDRGLFAEGAFGAEHGHALRRLEREAGGHDLAPDRGHVRPFERAGVGVLHLLDDLRHTVGTENGVPSRFLTSPTCSATSARRFSKLSSSWSMASICARSGASSGEAWGSVME